MTWLQATLKLKENIQPFFIKARKVPYALLPKVEKESDFLEKEDCHLTLEEGKYDFLFLVLRRNTIFQSELKSAQTFQR
ncbi:unnamed protein product [Callosobruchus maculatus]|uniref:Uncharacterized protein n=1 Tax=Callosobruchus maculatus TaxID=64391 RepID=A0A653BKU7_CALMS|nr:unnamed protein product [Callosobruchus maculatus]